MTRGIRNNNPGNIRKDGEMWKGEVYGTDKDFKTFNSMQWGVRAMFHLLNNYRLLHGCDTLDKLINRWAPPVENDTQVYVSFVSERAGVPKSSRIMTTNKDVMIPIVRAMIRMENGDDIPDYYITEGWDLFIKNK